MLPGEPVRSGEVEPTCPVATLNRLKKEHGHAKEASWYAREKQRKEPRSAGNDLCPSDRKEPRDEA